MDIPTLRNIKMIHPYAESRKRARKKWRQSPKGKHGTKNMVKDQKLKQAGMNIILKN